MNREVIKRVAWSRISSRSKADSYEIAARRLCWSLSTSIKKSDSPYLVLVMGAAFGWANWAEPKDGEKREQKRMQVRSVAEQQQLGCLFLFTLEGLSINLFQILLTLLNLHTLPFLLPPSPYSFMSYSWEEWFIIVQWSAKHALAKEQIPLPFLRYNQV